MPLRLPRSTTQDARMCRTLPNCARPISCRYSARISREYPSVQTQSRQHLRCRMRRTSVFPVQVQFRQVFSRTHLPNGNPRRVKKVRNHRRTKKFRVFNVHVQQKRNVRVRVFINVTDTGPTILFHAHSFLQTIIRYRGARQENRRYSPRIETCADYSGRSAFNGRANQGDRYLARL